jgi:hypothetical protein
LHRRLDAPLSLQEEKEFLSLILDHPEYRAEFESWVDIQVALKSVSKIEVPSGLSDRIADRVLRAPLAISRAWYQTSYARVAASFLLVAVLVVGTHFATEDGARAHRSDGDVHDSVILEAWAPYNLSDIQKSQILELKHSAALQQANATTEEARRLEDELISDVLRLLSDEQRAQYGRDHGLSDDEMRRRVAK